MAATIQSLERGLLVLDILGSAEEPLSLNSVAEHFSIDRSSVFRLISTLLKCGYVTQDSRTKSYSLGYKILTLSRTLTNHSRVEELVRPIMRHILAMTGQNTHLAVLEGEWVVFLAVERPTDHLALNISVGSREPAVVTALGKSMLAFQSRGELDSLLSDHVFKRYTAKSVSSKERLKVELERVKKNRLATDDEEYRSGIMCFAAPIFDHENTVRYSIGISGLKAAIEPKSREYAGIVKQAGFDASDLLLSRLS